MDDLSKQQSRDIVSRAVLKTLDRVIAVFTDWGTLLMLLLLSVVSVGFAHGVEYYMILARGIDDYDYKIAIDVMESAGLVLIGVILTRVLYAYFASRFPLGSLSVSLLLMAAIGIPFYNASCDVGRIVAPELKVRPRPSISIGACVAPQPVPCAVE
jgi:hypothetical protein